MAAVSLIGISTPRLGAARVPGIDLEERMTQKKAAPGAEVFTSFGALLRFLRQRAHTSQRELGIATGYSEAQVSRLESNQRAPDAVAVLARFVPALDLDDEPDLLARLMELAVPARTSSATRSAAGDTASGSAEAATPPPP